MFCPAVFYAVLCVRAVLGEADLKESSAEKQRYALFEDSIADVRYTHHKEEKGKTTGWRHGRPR